MKYFLALRFPLITQNARGIDHACQRSRFSDRRLFLLIAVILFVPFHLISHAFSSSLFLLLKHLNIHVAWISSDYFESLLLPQKTTRNNKMKFRLTLMMSLLFAMLFFSAPKCDIELYTLHNKPTNIRSKTNSKPGFPSSPIKWVFMSS